MKRPKSVNYPAYFDNYIKLVEGENVLKHLDEQVMDFQALLSDVSEEKENYSYAPGKWTIKEVVGHIIDTERIFAYRALCIARGEMQSLPGFDENKYVENGNFNQRSLYDLAHEFGVVRESSIMLFENLEDEILDKKGIANNNEISVRAILFAMVGHVKHHMNIVKERYLK